jgi:hypothetical protein
MKKQLLPIVKLGSAGITTNSPFSKGIVPDSCAALTRSEREGYPLSSSSQDCWPVHGDGDGHGDGHGQERG